MLEWLDNRANARDRCDEETATKPASDGEVSETGELCQHEEEEVEPSSAKQISNDEDTGSGDRRARGAKSGIEDTPHKPDVTDSEGEETGSETSESTDGGTNLVRSLKSERSAGRWEQRKAQGGRKSDAAENNPNPAVGSQNESKREEPRRPKERKPILDEGPLPQEREWWAKQTGRTEIEEAWARSHAGRMERRRRAELKREIEREVMSRWREKKRLANEREERRKRRDVQRIERERLEREGLQKRSDVPRIEREKLERERRESERKARERLEREIEALERKREEEELIRVEREREAREREREAREASERNAKRERLEREREAAEWKSGLYRFLPGKSKEESDNICGGVKILLGILLIMVVGAFLGDCLNS